jgi:predicted AlkP superfamily phosphohydrolase/phosphomutase
VKDREPEGIVDPADYHRVREELAAKLEALPDDEGRPMGTLVYRPEDVYPDVRGVAPDLIVYFGDLAWRSVGTVGTGGVYTFENDTGPDGANHAERGVFMMAGAPALAPGRQEGLRLVDVGPTILDLYGVEAPQGVAGRSLLS